MSHLLQMRGLKPCVHVFYISFKTSHLLQMRGLKRIMMKNFRFKAKSHLLQMRGLKPCYVRIKYYICVASFTDAWIETCVDRKEYWKENVASFTDAWIETLMSIAKGNVEKSHLLQMRGLKL